MADAAFDAQRYRDQVMKPARTHDRAPQDLTVRYALTQALLDGDDDAYKAHLAAVVNHWRTLLQQCAYAKQGRADLYDRYRRAAARIAAAERRQAAATVRGPVDATPVELDDLPALAAARGELDQVVTEIRGLPDHRRFLEEASFVEPGGRQRRAGRGGALPPPGAGRAPALRGVRERGDPCCVPGYDSA